jgi:hypothetical protein
MFTTAKSINRDRCMELETCYLRTGSAIKACSIKVVEMVSDSPSTLVAISIKVNTGAVSVRVKVSSKLTTADYMREDGVAIKCTGVDERLFQTESALLFTTRTGTS